MTPVDPRRCPLCGGPNHCGVIEEAGDCWCFTTDVPADVRARIPAAARDVACVCRFCAAGRRHPAVVAAQVDALLKRR